MADDDLFVEGSDLDNFGQGAFITVDADAAEAMAKAYDFQGRDLQIEITYDFGVKTPVNFVTIDPILFGTSAFPEIKDVATLEDDGEFLTVDGFASQAFDKVLTPEANKVVSDDLVSKTLAPSQYAYGGLGVFVFPLRETQKLKVTILMKDPVPADYERLYVLTQEVVTSTTNVTTSSSKGLF